MTQDQIQAAAAGGWRVSPLATAVNISAQDGIVYEPAPHLRFLSNKIRETVTRGGRLIVSMPPQHGKSQLISKWTPVWYMENWPQNEVVNAGYGADFASKWGRLVRNAIVNHAEQFSFKLADDSKAAERWTNDKGGSMLCVGIGSGITGNPAKLLIIDDPVKSWEQSNSYTYREKVWDWYTSEARTRVHPGGAIIVVLTRWNEDDIAGRLIKSGAEDWEVINLPAIYDEKAALLGPDPLGRPVGNVLRADCPPECALWPTRYTVHELMPFMRNSEEVWESLYQGRPGTTASLGNVYHAFESKIHVKAMDRDPMLRLAWSLDFNVDPMCSVISQYREFSGGYLPFTGQKWVRVDALDEICLPDCTTTEMLDEFLNRVKKLCGNQRIDLELYGDPAGQARHTSQVVGTDWDMVRDFFKGRGQFSVRYCVGRRAPAIKDRTNAVNSLLRNQMQEVRAYIHPRCKMLIRDLLNVKWKRDTSGNTSGQLDKSQKDLTHVSDSWGYFLEKKFGGNQSAAGGQAGIMQ